MCGIQPECNIFITAGCACVSEEARRKCPVWGGRPALGTGLDVIITATSMCTSPEVILCKTFEHERYGLPCPFSRGGNWAKMLLKVTELARVPKLGPMSPYSHYLFSPTEVPPLHNLWSFRDWEREGKCYQSPLKATTARRGWACVVAVLLPESQPRARGRKEELLQFLSPPTFYQSLPQASLTRK